MDRIIELLSTEAVLNCVLTAAGALAAWLFRIWIKDRARTEEERIALDALEGGVHMAWTNLREKAKEKMVDGKLSDKMRDELLHDAIVTAKDLASKNGVQLVKVFAYPKIASLIRSIVKKRKAEAVAAATEAQT